MFKKPKKIGILILLTLVLNVFFYVGNANAAPCSVKDELGSVSYNVSISQPGEYKLWTRLRPESKTANTLYLEIDGNACLVAGGDTSLAAKTWKWVDYSGTENKKKLIHTFESPGKHTISVSTDQAGVGIDRMILLAASDACVPSNKAEGGLQPGDNCKSDTVIAPTDPDDGIDTESMIASDQPPNSGKKIILSLTILFIVSVSATVIYRFKLWRRFSSNSSGGHDGKFILPQ